MYKKSDIAVCRSLWSELTQHHANLYGDKSISGDDPGRGFDVYLERPDRKGTWIAELDGKPVGFAGLLLLIDEEGVGEIEPVIVTSEYRRQGVGRELVKRIMREAGKAGARFLSVRPVARNTSAFAFFVKLGFATLGHLDLFQDLSASSDRDWKAGILIHGKRLRY
ncbi:MAG: GNAT family N-acetyltransferase [Dehalococcoidia bacterium]|nr:GNAT family N-acetyltransferase [Dehalococcoidia bacterium]